VDVIRPNASEAGALTGLGLTRFPVASIDSTGAGDAFAAAVAVGLARGLRWEQIGPLASAAAALKTTKLGAQAGLPTADDVLRFLDERGVHVMEPAALLGHRSKTSP
jgi:pfkB family carbohydrate kinase